MKLVNISRFDDARETLFITLHAKAKDSLSKHSLLHDTKAYDILKSVDYDFSKVEKSKKALVVLRAKQMDEWTKEFIAAHENAVVVYIGCGLDSRITRISPPATINWYDLDFPSVIEERKKFYADNEQYKMIASSATDVTWLEQIPNDRPALIIAEGVLEYIQPENVSLLLQRLTDYFSEGQILFDVVNLFALNYANKNGNVHQWGIDDSSEIEKWNPKLKKLNEIPLSKSIYIKELPFSQRVIYTLMPLIPKLKNMIRVLRYRF